MPAPKRLIVNADGFGFGPGATQGVIDALGEGGFISSISVTPNFPDVERIGEFMKRFADVSIGVHLNPMVGRPCLPAGEIPSLVDRNGFFHGRDFARLLKRGRISVEELETELDAQMQRVMDLAGRRVTHLDSHGNRHLDYFRTFLRVAQKWKLERMRNNASLICLESDRPGLSRVKVYLSSPQVWLAHQYRKMQMWIARRAGLRMADHLVTVGYAGNGNKARVENWMRILRNLPPGTHEIYCHPAYPDQTLRHWAAYNEERARELAVLRGRGLVESARQLGIDIISFNAI